MPASPFADILGLKNKWIKSVYFSHRQYIGDHIKCITDGHIPADVINSFCFFTPTFTVVSYFACLTTSIEENRLILWFDRSYNIFMSVYLVWIVQVRHYNESMLAGGFLPHPGVGNMGPDEKVKHHAYYQWVPFVLFGQAMFFFLPHFLWRLWEGNFHFQRN